jgi:hypothetical protein
MKKLIFILLASIFSLQLQARAKDVGVGIVIGDPIGFTGKMWLSNANAVDATIGWSGGHIHLHGDYLWHNFSLFKIDTAPFDLFYGVGGRLNQREKDDKTRTHLGVRGPVGVRYMFKSASIETFIELAGVMDFVPDMSFDLDFGIGARYFF